MSTGTILAAKFLGIISPRPQSIAPGRAWTARCATIQSVYMHIRVPRAVLPLALLLPASILVAQKQPFDAHTLMQLARVSDPQLSPDGRSVAFTVQTIDIEKNA